MNEMPPKSKLDSLLQRINRVEARLNSAAKELERISEEKSSIDLYISDFTLSAQEEKFAALEWTQSVENILVHRPETFEELKFKTFALFNLIQTGKASIEVLDVVKSDIRAFSSQISEPIVFETMAGAENKQTFLLIDDNQIDRMLIKKALMKAQSDADFVELEDGTDVVKVIKQNRPCVTLLDIRMPGIDGFDVLKLIREDNELKDHPVWMLSTSSEGQDIDIAMETGASGYYSKPTSVSEYTKLASSILESVAA